MKDRTIINLMVGGFAILFAALNTEPVLGLGVFTVNTFAGAFGGSLVGVALMDALASSARPDSPA